MNKQILKTVEAYLLTNREFLDEGKIRGLEEQILHIKKQIWEEERSVYLKQLKAFKNHMNNCFEILMGDDCTSESVDLFYNSDFVLTFRGKSVRLANGADIFQGIEELIAFEISEYEEE